MDHWCGYNERFYSFINNKRKFIFPRKIFVSDIKSKIELSKSINYNKKNIIVSGNPSWDKFKLIKSNKNTKILNNKKFNKNKKTLLFISEVISEEKRRIKYDFSELDILSNIITLYEDKYNILIKQHPREKNNKYSKFLNDHKNKNIILLRYELNIYDILYCCNIIIGMTSALLVELKLFGYNPLSYQPTKFNKPIINFGFGIKKINSLNKISNYENSKVIKSKYHFKALDKILKIII